MSVGLGVSQEASIAASVVGSTSASRTACLSVERCSHGRVVSASSASIPRYGHSTEERRGLPASVLGARNEGASYLVEGPAAAVRFRTAEDERHGRGSSWAAQDVIDRSSRLGLTASTSPRVEAFDGVRGRRLAHPPRSSPVRRVGAPSAQNGTLHERERDLEARPGLHSGEVLPAPFRGCLRMAGLDQSRPVADLEPSGGRCTAPT